MTKLFYLPIFLFFSFLGLFRPAKKTVLAPNDITVCHSIQAVGLNRNNSDTQFDFQKYASNGLNRNNFDSQRYASNGLNGMALNLNSNTTDGMHQFASDPNFQALHFTPKAIDFEGIGNMITMPTVDSLAAKAYFIKAKSKSKKWLFVYQEWWGLNDNIKQYAEKFYNSFDEKVNVLAIDMYDGKSATEAKEAGKLMQGVKEARLNNIVNSAVAFAGKKALIGNVGWCFGGSWSLKSAILGKKQTVGSVMYYGMPVKDVEQLKTLNSDVLGLFATENYISKVVVEEFALNMKTAGKQLEYKIFPGVHGFANPSNPKYDKENADIAYEMATSYLKKRLKI